MFFDRNQDQVVDGGFAGLENLIDAAENWTSTDLLNFSPAMKGYWGGRWHDLENPTFGWLQLLNQLPRPAEWVDVSIASSVNVLDI